MPTESKIRQQAAPGSRNVPLPLKLSSLESAALHMVAQVHGTTPQDLIRERSINDIVKEYDKLVAKAAGRAG